MNNGWFAWLNNSLSWPEWKNAGLDTVWDIRSW